MFAVTGLVKYGVAHYVPPAARKKFTIGAPIRPNVQFHNADPIEVADIDDEYEDDSAD